MNIAQADVQWKDVKIHKINTEGPAHRHPYKHTFSLPEPLASWDVFDYWERERFDSMERHLKQGDTLFDIGTEQGWCNLIYAQFVGADNMVLIEPTPEFWPNIRTTWERNYADVMPKAFYAGLFSNETEDMRQKPGNFTHWPFSSEGDLIDRNAYQYIFEHSDEVPLMELDEYVKRTGIIPKAITIDTEGSELLILQGARDTLERHHPKLWVSIHPELSQTNYKTSKEDVLRFMQLVGYNGQHIATDHEEHWYFEASDE